MSQVAEMDASEQDEQTRALFALAARYAADHAEDVRRRPVGPTMSAQDALAAFDAPLAENGEDGADVLSDLTRLARPGLVRSDSPMYFGFVIGGASPVAIAADWLTSSWDQLTGLAAIAPATSAIEHVAGRWLLELFGLGRDWSFAFVTGCQMAHLTALAAARHRVLSDVGWNVERDGLVGAPTVRILANAGRHVSVDRAVRLLGLGEGLIEAIAVDERGAMRPDALAAALAGADAPTIVCAQAGDLHTGAIDPLPAIFEVCEHRRAWVHVDGAFGLWAAASASKRHLLGAPERADSWATDAHKWLNVPYDCGLALVRDADAHRSALALTAPYLIQGDAEAETRDAVDWTPEFSRRARAVPVYAALRSLGRTGVEELVDRLCDCASRFAQRLPALDDVEVVAHGLNQVLIRIADDDAATDSVIAQVQTDGTIWAGGTTWLGRRCMRLSVCNWQTTPAHIDAAIDAIAEAVGAVAARRSGR